MGKQQVHYALAISMKWKAFPVAMESAHVVRVGEDENELAQVRTASAD